MKGFSLLEILITIILLASGVAAIIWSLTAGLAHSVNVEGMDIALGIAQANMESVTAMTYDEINTQGTTPPVTDPNFTDYKSRYRVTKNQDPLQIDVEVTWDTGGGEAELTLTTLVADI